MRIVVAAIAGASLLSACGVRAGERLPSFAVRTASGAEVSAAALRGHATIVDLWSPGCIACVGEFPALQRLQDDLGPRGLRVIALYDRGGARDGRLVGDGAGVRFPIARIGGGLMRRLGGWEFPTTLLVGKDGRVRTVVHGDPGEGRLRAMTLSLLSP